MKHKIFFWVLFISSLIVLVFSIALIIRVWAELGYVALYIGLFFATLALIGAVYGIIRLWLDLRGRHQQLRIEAETHAHTQKLEAEKYANEQRLALQRLEYDALLARQEFELRRHLALTRVEPDNLGNYAHLLGTHEYTALPPGNTAYPARIGKMKVSEEQENEEIHRFPAPVVVPTLAEQIAQGITQPYEQESILGYDANGARRGPWHKLHSFSAFGGSGSGKSSTVAYYAALAVLHGARLLIIDPDAEEDESITKRLAPLAPFFLAPVGDTPEQATRVLALAEQELESPGAYPVVWIIDEFTTIVRDGKMGGKWAKVATKLAVLVEDYGQRGRKRRRTAIVIGQIIKATRTGGTELRASMTATFIHRIKPQQARMILDADEANECEYLEPGEVMVLLNNAVTTYRMRIPYADIEDMQRVAQLMLTERSTQRSDGVQRPEIPPSLHVVRTSERLHEHNLERAWQAKVDRVRELRAKEVNQQQIIWQVWGVTKGGSSEYAKARDEYLQIVSLLNTEVTGRAHEV